MNNKQKYIVNILNGYKTLIRESEKNEAIIEIIKMIKLFIENEMSVKIKLLNGEFASKEKIKTFILDILNNEIEKIKNIRYSNLINCKIAILFILPLILVLFIKIENL